LLAARLLKYGKIAPPDRGFEPTVIDPDSTNTGG
jgi:hypothetical protein